MERDARGLGGAWAEHQQVAATAPPSDLAPWVDRIWTVTWSYDPPYRQLIPPHLDVHLTFPSDTAPTITGPATRARHRVLAGTGSVVGVALRPGVARAVLGRRVADLADTAVPAADVLPALLGDDVWPDVADIVGADGVVELLRRALPTTGPDPAATWCADVVDRIRAEADLRRVDDLAAAVGASVRQLQRRFAEHVGLPPKQVLRQVRLREVTARLDAGAAVDWAAVAADLGYVDQAHLSRDVAALLGEPPTAFAARF